MTPLNIGLIGTGYMGKCHALAWNAVAPVFGDVRRPRLAILAEASQELAEKKASELGFERATGDWRTLVTDPEIDVVSITTPNAFHPEMAIAALDAGKHVWCEKPMATRLEDAERMLAAARASGKIAALGYNYIQNPAMRLIRRILDEEQIGEVNHVRLEMDEDFMANPEDLFYWKSEASSGHGALDDFGVHPLSLLWVLLGGVRRVCGHMAKPYADRPVPGGGRRAVETYDIATVLMELESGASGLLAVNRSAWGRKGRITLQIFGSKGTTVFDQERMNEVQLYTADGSRQTHGFRTILTGPQHSPYDKFIPAPGHGLGFNDLKVIECREVMRRITGETAHLIEFEDGIRIERTVDAMARSAHGGRWVEVEVSPSSPGQVRP